MSRSARASLALLAFGSAPFAAASHPHVTRPLTSHHQALQHTATHTQKHDRASAAHVVKAAHHPPHSRHQIPQPPEPYHHARNPGHAHDTGHRARAAQHTVRITGSRHVTHEAPIPVVSLIRQSTFHPQLVPLTDTAADPITLPRLYNDRGRLLVPAALVGSHEILLHQNEMAEQDGLGRVQNDADLDAMRARGMLVQVPTGAALAIDDRLPYNRRFARPWTTSFLNDLARAHYDRFHSPLQVNSAVRTVEFQQQLIHRNGNAAPAEGDTASPHLTGQAVDLAKRGMPLAEIAWMRGYLLPLIEAGKIDVEEEFKQSCFHISVYKRYAPATAPEHYNVASRGTTSTLTTILR